MMPQLQTVLTFHNTSNKINSEATTLAVPRYSIVAPPNDLI